MMMKRLLTGIALILGSACIMQAQELAGAGAGLQLAASTNFSATTDARFPMASAVRDPGDLFGVDATPPVAATASFAGSSSADFAMPAPVPSAALSSEPDPAPNPTFIYGGRDDYRWQLGLAAGWERFRSSIFNASAVGVNTSISYYLNNWLGVEGNVLAAFAPEIFDNDPVRVFNLTGGPRIAWRQRRWEPWLHGLVGLAHEQPQTAAGSRNSFAAQVGGGVDYRINPRLSLRLQGDLLHTMFFSQSQNNFTLAAGAVIHF
jgi:hypothetical protein